jgi:hypothetical protein
MRLRHGTPGMALTEPGSAALRDGNQRATRPEVEAPGSVVTSLPQAHALASYSVLINATKSALSWSVSNMPKRVS